MSEQKSLIAVNQFLEQAVVEWLHEKQTRTGSQKTQRAYKETMNSFRNMLWSGSMDLDSDPQNVARVAQAWAGIRAQNAKVVGAVSPATYNQRLAIISSFYTFLQEARQLDYVNPIESVKRRPVQAYASATPIDADEVAESLAAIDRSTSQGKRDYALLAVALETGRRASELVSIRWRHVRIAPRQGKVGITVTFENCKGGKTMKNTLGPDTAEVLLDYLNDVYGNDLTNLPLEAPIWVSFSRQNSGAAISTHTLNDICEQYLGTSKIHTLRHTFAVEMEKVGAPLSEIQARLGHENITTTSIYMKSIRSAENPFASRLASRFGISKEQKP